MKNRKIFAAAALIIILAAGLYAVIWSWAKLPPTFDGTQIDPAELYEHPQDVPIENIDGAAAVIVRKNLGEAYAANDVASVVFDFRGYDTLGESFILLTAIAGSYVILSTHASTERNSRIDALLCTILNRYGVIDKQMYQFVEMIRSAPILRDMDSADDLGEKFSEYDMERIREVVLGYIGKFYDKYHDKEGREDW